MSKSKSSQNSVKSKDIKKKNTKIGHLNPPTSYKLKWGQMGSKSRGETGAIELQPQGKASDYESEGYIRKASNCNEQLVCRKAYMISRTTTEEDANSCQEPTGVET